MEKLWEGVYPTEERVSVFMERPMEEEEGSKPGRANPEITRDEGQPSTEMGEVRTEPRDNPGYRDGAHFRPVWALPPQKSFNPRKVRN